MAIFQKHGRREAPGKTEKKKEFNWHEENRTLIGLINSGEIDRALTVGLELVDRVDRLYRKDCREKATTYNNMGMVFMLNRDYELADQSFREALAMRMRIFGDDHNEVAVVLLNMAELYRRQAREIMSANVVEAE